MRQGSLRLVASAEQMGRGPPFAVATCPVKLTSLGFEPTLPRH